MDGSASPLSLFPWVSLPSFSAFLFLTNCQCRTHDPDDGVALEDKEGVVYYKDLDCFPCEGPAVKMVPKAAVPAY